MNKIEGTIIVMLALLYFTYSGYSPWFKPKKYFENISKTKEKLKSQQILPDGIIDMMDFYGRSLMTIWWARIFSAFAIILCVAILFVIIFEP
jgi:hypothetical protein